MTSDKTPDTNGNISNIGGDEFDEIITPLGENVGEDILSVRNKGIGDYLEVLRKKQKEGDDLRRKMDLVHEMIEEIERIKRGSDMDDVSLKALIEQCAMSLEEQGVDPDLLFLELSHREPGFTKLIK